MVCCYVGRASRRAVERANERASERSREQASERASDRTSEGAHERASQRTSERASKRTSERASAPESERAGERATRTRYGNEANNNPAICGLQMPYGVFVHAGFNGDTPEAQLCNKNHKQEKSETNT